MSSLSHHGIKGQKWGVRRFQNKDGTLTAAGRKRKQHLIEVGSGKRKRLVEAAKPIGTSGDYSKDVSGLNRRGIHGQIVNEDDNTHIIKKGASIYRTAANSELNDDGTYGSLTKNDVDRYIDYGRSGELPGADKSNLNSMRIFEFSANRDLKIANGKYITEIITDDVKRKMKNGDADQVKLGKEILKSFKGYEEDLNLSFSTSEMRRSKEAYSRTEEEKEFDRDLVGKASDRLALYDKTILDYSSGKDYRVIRDRLKREGYDGFIDVEDVTTIENLVRGGANTEYPVVILNANDVLTLKRSVKESETQRRLKRGTKFNSSRGELTNAIQHTSIGGTMYIEGNTLILGDSSYLEHHGILGQKWGVRRFQNKDGTRTAAGKARDQKNAAKQVVLANRRTRNQWQYQNSFTKAQDKLTNKSRDSVREMARDALNGKHKAEYETAVEEYDAATNYRYDEYRKEENKYLAIAGMASGNRYPMLDPDKFDQDTRLKWDAEFYMYDDGDQGKYNSYDYFLVAKGENPNKVFARAMNARKGIENVADKDVDDILGDYKDHPINSKVLNTTIKTTAGDALKERIVDMATSASDYTMVWEHQITYTDDEIKSMKNDIKKYEKEAKRLGLIHSDLSIEDGTLYLSHHGIRGQRWGVRRFQNRDGSLTNAGRKRLGYATKGAAQTVGRAFKAGVKAGGKAIKAVKAHHEASEAKKKEKKKEKASKTRLGVMANKDLFTNEEIRKLNERFKLEDEMKMATLQKGVEIAKAVGVIAQNVGTVAKAYEDVTGTSLSPIKKAKQEAEAKEKAEDRKRKLAKEDAETKRAEDKEKRDIEDRERRIKFEDEDRVRKQAKEDADAQRAENAEKRAQAKEQRDSSMAVELQRKAKAAADEQEHKAVKAKAESRSAILDVLEKIDKIQDYDDDDHNNNNPPGGGIDTWNDDDYLNFFKKTGIIHSGFIDSDPIQNGVLFVDSSDGLSHHGVKGQRWGVRRFQNEDGSLTEKGRKHYEKAIEKLDRKQVNSDNRRGALERRHPYAVTASAILTGSAYAALMVASAANPAMVVAGSAIAASISALGTHVDYSVAEAWEARGTKRRQKKRKEYEEMLNHDGMYHVENGTLFIDAGEPYLEHHGVKGMKWGKHLMAGKSEAGAGGGGGEDDEKLKEMAKKAGMTVAEYKQKFASKIGGAASKVGEKVYDAAGGKYKKEAEAYRREAQKENAESQYQKARAHKLSAASASEKRKAQKLLDSGDNSGYVNASINSKNWKSSADSAEKKSREASKRRESAQKTANAEQSKYKKSLAGRYDKMKADRARKKSIKKRQSVERALSNGPVEAKPKKSLGKRLEEKLGVTHEKTRGKKQSKEAKRIEDMYKDAARKDKAFSGTSPKAKKKVRIESASAMGFSTNNPYSIPVDARKWGYNGTNKSRVSVGKRGSAPKTILNPKHTDTSHRKKSVGEVMNNARKEQTPGSTPISKPTQYTHTNRPRGREKYYKLGQESKGVKKRSRRVRHFDNSNELYTEGTRLVINSKWG